MRTSGIPNVSPLTTSTGSIAGSEGGSDYKDEGSKYVFTFNLLSLEVGTDNVSKTTIAVSVSVISVAVVVICTVLGLYLYKRRKARREQEEASQQGTYRFTGNKYDHDLADQLDHIMSQRDWDY